MGSWEKRDRERREQHGRRLGAAGGPAAEAFAVGYLRSLPPAQLVRVLQQVFAGSVPFTGEGAWCRSRWFLGIAHAYRESDPDEPVRWEPWRIEVAAYHLPDLSPGGPDDLGQSSGGGGCCGGISHRSNVKLGVCPICGGEVGMT